MMIDFFFLFFQMESLGHLNRKIRRRRSRKCEFCFCSEWNVYSEWIEIVVCVDCCRGEDDEEGFWVGGLKNKKKKKKGEEEGKKNIIVAMRGIIFFFSGLSRMYFPLWLKKALEIDFTSLDFHFPSPSPGKKTIFTEKRQWASKQYLFSFLFLLYIYINVVPSVWLSLL